MVRPASFDKNGMKRGAWSEEEDNKLRACIKRFGHPNWRLLPLVAGLKRCGKSCRLRWVNYLKPGLRRGKFTKDEKHLIIQLHNQLGNKWAAIAAHFPGRTDNDIKNYWHAHIHKRRNRNGLTRAMRIQNLDQEEQSNSDNNNNSSTITTTTGPNPAENTGVFESNADSVFNAPCFTNVEIDRENFAEQESIMSPLCDWGISPWNYLAAAAKPEPDFSTYYSVEEDLFNVNFGDNYYEYVQISEHIYP